MNKIFKVIWNHATQSWVAVSEFTKAHGKTKSVKLSAVATAIAAAATVGGTAHAAVSIGTTTGTTIATVSGGTASAGISIGETASTETANDIAIGQGATIDRGDPNSPVGSIVIGNKAESTGQFGDIVIGAFSKTGKALGHPGNPSQITVIGSRSFAYGNQASVLSSDAVATGSSSIAMGGDDINDARAALDRDVAEFKAANNKAIKDNYAFIWHLVDPVLTERLKNTRIEMAGYGAVNPELKDTAAANLNNTHFLRTWAAGDASIALGYAAQTLGTGSHAIGVNAVAYSTASNAIGLLARAGDSDETKVAGSTNANAFGTAAVAAAKDSNAIGHNATVASGAVGAIAFGVNASATAASNVVIGSNSNELSSTNAVGGQGNKIDSGTVGGVPYSGFAGDDKLVGVVSVGNGDQTRQIINVAPGAITAESTDAINGSQLYQVLKPINFKANSNQDAAVTEPAPTDADPAATKQVFAAGDGAQIPLDKTLNIVGATKDAINTLAKSEDAAVAGTYSAKNIQTVVTANDELQIQMAENPEFTSAKIGDTANGKAPITIGTVDENGTPKNVISGLDSTLPKTVNKDDNQAPTTVQAAPTLTPADLTKAATIEDVLNAGWNLQNNGTEKDFVKPYDTVNFIDGQGTKAVVNVRENGTIADVKFDVDVTQLSAPVSNVEAGDEAGSLVGPADAPELAEALKNAEEALAALPQDATPEARKEAEDKVAAAKDAITNAGNQLATAQNVANSVNNSFWKLNTSQDSANEAKVGDGKVNPSNDVVFNGVGAVKVSSKTASTEESKYIIDIALDTAALSAVEAPNTNTNTGEVKSPVEAAQEALDAAKQELADLPADAPEDVRKAAEEKVAAAQNAVNNAPNALATAANVANAINNSGWNVTSGTVGSGARSTDADDAKTEELINPSETVTFNAGDNLVIKQKGNEFTYSLNKDININSANIGGVADNPDTADVNEAKAPITIGTVDENGTPKNVISGLDSTLPKTVNKDDNQAPTTVQAAPTLTPADLTKAATIEDVLNAGWNLQNNGTEKDFVKPYDTVNFIDGQGTKAVVNVRENGTIADVKFDVDVTQLSAPVSNVEAGDEAGSLVGPADAPELAEALKNAEEALAALPQDATPEARKEAEDKVAAAKDAITNAGNQLATAQNVANSVNNSFWKLNTSQDSANEAKVGDGKVNPSNDVVFNGVGAVKVSSKTAGTEESKYIIDIALDTAALSAVEAPNTNTNTGEVKSPVEAAQEALDAAKQELADLPADAPEDVRKAAEEKVAAAQNAVNNAPNALATAANVANAINNSGWNVTSGTVGSGARSTDADDAKTEELINPSETVTFNAGDNLVIKQKGNEFTYSLNKDININSANIGGVADNPDTADVNEAKAPITIGTVDENGTPKNVISGLDSTLPKTVNKDDNQAPTTVQAAPTLTPADLTKAATIEDVLNAGWNLQNNGTEKDFVKPYDTVNFIDGQGTKAVVNVRENGTIADVKFDVDVTQLSAPVSNVEAGDEAGSLVGPADAPELAEALKNAEEALAALPQDATPEARKEAEDKVAAAKDAITNAGNQLATAQNVANSVNNSFWKLNTSQDSANEAKVGDGKVNPSNDVVFNGVGAVKVSSKTAGTEESKYIIDIALDTAALSAVQIPDTNTNTGEVKSPVEAAQEALDAAKKELADLPADAPEDVRKAAEDKVAAAQNAVNNAPNALATAANVANAINNSGWNVTSGTVGSGDREGADATVELINPSETVTFNAGDNLVIKQKGNEFTYSLNKDININSANIGGVADNPDTADVNEAKAPITIGTVDENGTPKNVISGLDSTLPKTVNKDDNQAPTTAQAAPTLTPADLTKAATIEDVLNAGWNLQNNGTEKDFVKPYDTVNFIDGQGTKAVVNVRENGTIADVKFDVDVTQLSAPVSNVEAGDEAGSLVGPADAPELAEALKNAEEALAALPQDATPEARKAAEDKVAVAKDAITNAGNQLATAQNVANSVNNSFWKLNTSQDSANEAKVGDGKVNPSNDVVFNGVGAVKVSSKTASTEESKYIIDIALDTAALSAVEAPNTNTNTGEVKSPVEAAQEALDAAKQELADLPADAPEDVRKAAEDKVAAAENALNNAPNALATAANVANAINNSGWNVTSGTVGSGARDGDAATVELINPSETVTFNAGDNLVIKQEGNEFTYSLNKDIKVDSVTANQAFFGGSPETEDAPAKAPIIIGTTPAGKNVVSNLDTTIAAPTTANNPADKPTEAQQSNAATLGDVLNAGWNLQENGTAKDVVTPYDTVNFVDGQGTTVKIDTTNGTVSNVTVNVKVDGSTIKFDDNGNLTAVQPDTEVNGNKVGGNINLVDSDTVSVAPVTDDKGDPTGGIQFNVNTASITPVTEGDKAGSVTGPVTPALTDALKAAQDELAALPADASEEVKQAAADKVAAAQNAVNKAGNAIATAQNVADAINASGWNATSGKVGTGDVKGTTNELINPSETVTFNAGDNLVLEQKGNEFTYSLNKDININSAIIGGSPETEDAPAKAPIIIGTTPVDPENPAKPVKNVISGLDHTLPTAKDQTAGSVNEGDISPVVNAGLAATVGDVLNAGWNLQENGTAKDLVTAYNTVNFANGTGTAVNITSANDVSVVKVDVKTANSTTINLGTDKDGNIVANANTSPITVNVENGSIAAPANPNALATSGNVADAIKGSGFTLTAQGQNGSVVNPGETVDMKNTDGNISITKDAANNDVVYNLSPTINVTNVNAAGNVNAGSVTTGGLTVKPNSKVDMGGNRVTNVAPGVDPTDAVNVSQLKDEIGKAVAPIHNRINKTNKDLRAGIAGANAAAGLPQVYIPGKSMVAASAGTFKGQSAVAVGYSRASDNGKLILKLQGNANTRGDVGGSIGVGYQW